MRINKWYLILILALTGMEAMGQARLGVSIVSFPGSGSMGDTTTYFGTILINNYGNATFSDSVYLDYEVDSSVHLSTNPGVGIYFADTAYLMPGDSVQKQILVHFTPSIFSAVGTSGVVIWPVCPETNANLLPPDTATYDVSISWPAGIAQTEGEKLLVYMDGQELNIKTDAGNLLSHVRIYDVNGKLIEEQAVTSSAIIGMDNYAAGMYIAEVIFTDQSRKDYKIINVGGH
jgi:hypothetical protein